MKKKKFVKKLVFNLVELYLIIIIGNIIRLNNVEIFILLLFFTYTKFYIVVKYKEKTLHYAKMYKCAVGSASVMTTLFEMGVLNFGQACLLAIMNGYLLTTLPNIRTKEILEIINDDIFHWSGKSSKYDPLKDFIKRNPNNKYIIENERYWEEHYYDRYVIFINFFRENKSYSEINSLLGKSIDDNNKIKEECKIIYSTFEKSLRLPPI